MVYTRKSYLESLNREHSPTPPRYSSTPPPYLEPECPIDTDGNNNSLSPLPPTYEKTPSPPKLRPYYDYDKFAEVLPPPPRKKGRKRKDASDSDYQESPETDSGEFTPRKKRGKKRPRRDPSSDCAESQQRVPKSKPKKEGPKKKQERHSVDIKKKQQAPGNKKVDAATNTNPSVACQTRNSPMSSLSRPRSPTPNQRQQQRSRSGETGDDIGAKTRDIVQWYDTSTKTILQMEKVLRCYLAPNTLNPYINGMMQCVRVRVNQHIFPGKEIYDKFVKPVVEVPRFTSLLEYPSNDILRYHY